MRNLFSTRVKIVLVAALLLAAGLAILSGITNTTPVHLVVQGVLAPFRGAATALTSAAETYYSYHRDIFCNGDLVRSQALLK